MKQYSMPFGRVNEFITTLTEEQKQRASIKHALRLGDNSIVKIWKTRKALARAIRKEEKNAPHSQWTPVVPLAINEGYD